MKSRFKRLMLIGKMSINPEGYKKGRYLKKIKYFCKQGENLYWQPIR